MQLILYRWVRGRRNEHNHSIWSDLPTSRFDDGRADLSAVENRIDPAPHHG